MGIFELIKSDHRKVEKLFLEIESTDNIQQIYEYFNQLYRELTIHAQAEELTLYPSLREYEDTDDLLREATEEHTEAKELLEELKLLSPNSSDFKVKAGSLKEAVQHHVIEEETEIFDVMRGCMNDEQLEELGEEFSLAKRKLQKDITVPV